MGADSIINILSKVPEGELRNELTREINEYESYAKTIETMIYDMGDTPKEENILTKMGAKIGIAMNTMNDSSTQHIAQMVIEGATMGVTEIIRLIRENENAICSEKVLKLAKDIVAFEEDTIERMKKFL
jgi:hypothetical protein